MKLVHDSHHSSAAAFNVGSKPDTSANGVSIGEGDLRLFRIFRAVAEAGGLAAAETELGMDRSTISRQLAALEARLSARLCFRGPGGFELTEFGRAVLRAAINAHDTLQMIGHELNRARSVMTGSLHIGIADNCLTNPECKLVTTLTRFRQLAPDVTVHLSIHLPSDLLAKLADRQLQLAITGTTRGVTGTMVGDVHLRCMALFKEVFKLYVAQTDDPPPTLSSLLAHGYELIVRERDPHTSRLVECLGIARHGVSVGLEAVATLLASGCFAGFLPTHYAESLDARWRFVPVQDAEELNYTTLFSLVQVEDRQLAPSTDLFVRLLQETHLGVENENIVVTA
ncbi:LysR family transcriptional regulator [Paraburkholderia sediminicola]|uniref:LysR family transcriptional regulator n=1 Tax=Paraburkholderia sediminicola TaxID=458836 RepID=UPI0038BAC705